LLFESFRTPLSGELSRAEQIATLNDGVGDESNDGGDDLWLPRDVLLSKVVPSVVLSFVALAAVFCTAIVYASTTWGTTAAPDHQLSPQKPEMTNATPATSRRKFCYQMTNLFANLFLGVSGLYYECCYHPGSTYANVGPEDSVRGYVDAVFFSGFQLGYQLWAIPIGLFWVNESWPMLIHHLAVIWVSSMSGFLANGFRYWTPFFYGVIELSSVPLAVMNTFKDDPDLRVRYPTTYLAVRLTFAFMFLYIRIVMFTPRMVYFLRDHYLLFSARTDSPLYQAYMSIVWLSSAFLLALQWWWASLIVRGIVRLVLPSPPPSSDGSGGEKKSVGAQEPEVVQNGTSSTNEMKKKRV